MKILLQNQYDGPLGGVETYFQLIVQALLSRGIEVAVVYTASGEKPFRREKNYKAYYLPNLDLDENAYYSGKRKPEIQKDLDSLEHIVKLEKPDIIHLNNTSYPGQFLKLRQYALVVQTIHDYYNCCNILLKTIGGDICPFAHGRKCFESGCVSSVSVRELWRFKVKYQNRQATKDFDKIFVASEYMKAMLCGNGFSEEKITVMPLFAEDWDKEQPVPGRNTIIYVGRLAQEKGLAHFIQMLRLISCDFEAFIIGDGPQREECENLVKVSGLDKKVKFTGFLGRNELAKYFARTNVVVVPSIWPEPFCMVGLEAMVFAKPIVAYASGGIREWLEDGHNGYLVNRGDIESLARRVEDILRDENLSGELGKNGRRLFEANFTEKAHCEKLISMYEALIAPRNKKRFFTARKKPDYPVRLKNEAFPEYNKRLIKFEFENNITQVRSYPEEITISTTSRCNMDPPCVICERNLRLKAEERDLNDGALNNLKPIFKYADTIYLHCGGEPLMTQKSFDIIDSVQPPTKIIFNTNGALLNNERIEYMLERGTVDLISFSLDAATKRTYQRIRSADFNKVINNIMSLISRRNQSNRNKSLNKPAVLLNFCIFKQNIAEVADFVLLAASLGADGIDFSHMNQGFNWRQKRADYEFDYSAEHVSNMPDYNYHDSLILKAYKLGVEHKIPINFNGNPFLGNLDADKKKVKADISEFIKYRSKCIAPWNRAVIDIDGRVRMCYFHRVYIDKSIGSLQNAAFRDIWNGEEAIAVRKEFINMGIAKRCITGNPCIYQNRI